MKAPRTDLPPEIYPDDPWQLVEDRWAPRFIYLTETIFALSNGNLGIRGTLDEGAPVHAFGTFLNGFHETWPIVHPESAYGFAHTGQTIVNIPDASVIEIEVDGETLGPETSTSFRRWIDFRHGILERETRWLTTGGVQVRTRHRRLVSLSRSDTIAFQLEISVDHPVEVAVRSLLVNRQDADGNEDDIHDPRRAFQFSRRVLEPVAASFDELAMIQSWVTASSALPLVTAVDHEVSGMDPQVIHIRENDVVGLRLSGSVRPDTPLRISKFAVYRADPGTARDLATAGVREARRTGFAALAEVQQEDLARFWEMADVEVDAGPEIQRAIRWTLFQLHQASACLTGRSIPAKGLTGQAYDGHYFWDTEIYVLPFLAAADPRAAAEILRFRHSLLPAARHRAMELAQRGALFPWRTITGDEASAYFLAGTAQYHINADIVYALRHYVWMTADEDLLWEIGVELAIETARLWEDLGFYRAGRFHIHGVTGPDEYTALVDDNAYTNAMARMNLRYACEVVARMQEERPEQFETLARSVGLDPGEPEAWRQAADAMFIPHDAELGITPQDAHFLEKEVWDFEATPPSSFPLLLHFHPLVIYRFQVLKQADVMLADFLLGDEFSEDLKRRNYEYYDPITTGDSSLSACVQSIMAAEVGKPDAAFEHFSRALFMDLADLAGNTTDGVHMASAGGVWLALTAGFAGLRLVGGELHLSPRLPEKWHRLRFKMTYRRTLLDIEVRSDMAVVGARGGSVAVATPGGRVTVADGEAVEIDLTKRSAG